MADTSALTLKEDPSIFKIIYGNKGLMTGLVILAVLSLIALFGPIFTESPTSINPMIRIKPPGADMWFGTDPLGRDIFARSVWGGRISLSVGVAVAVIAVGFGLVLGLLAGYIRILDAIIMRVMDGLMAIPGILLAIALISLTGATLFTVIVAITIPEIPRVVRLVRSVVLTVREELM